MKITKRQLGRIIRESLLMEAEMLSIMVNPYEDLDTMNRVANYALTNDIKGALADENVNYENLDLDLDEMKGWVGKVGKDDRSFSDGAVVPDNWDLDAVRDFMDDLENAWYEQGSQKDAAAHKAAPAVKEREAIGSVLTQNFVLPDEIKGITFQIRRKGGNPSNINIETDQMVSNINDQTVRYYGVTFEDIIKVLQDGGATERKKQKPVRHTPPMYD